MHRLLKRQLNRLFPHGLPEVTGFKRFIDLIEEAYRDYDEAHHILERSLDISLEELNTRNEYLQRVLKSIPDSYFLLTDELIVRDFRVNCDLYDVFDDVNINEVLSEHVLVEHSAELPLLIKQVIITGEQQDTVIQILKDEDPLFLEVRCRQIDTKSLLLTLRNVTDRFIAEKLRAQALLQSQRSQSQLQDVINAAPVGIIIVDLDYRIRQVNEFATKCFSQSADVLTGQSCLQLLITQHRAIFLEKLQSIVNDGKPITIDISMKTFSEVSFMANMSLSLVTLDSKIHIIQTFTDITDRIAMEGQLRMMATTDPLTGIFNRRSFDEEMLTHLQDPFSHNAIIMMDLDHFKKINDQFGHSVGDDVIVSAVNTVLKGLRKRDLFGRYGGEEFIIGLPDTSLTSATLIAEQLRISVEMQTLVLNDKKISITASFGVVGSESGINELTPLILEADKNLYKAKRQGRNSVISSSVQQL